MDKLNEHIQELIAEYLNNEISEQNLAKLEQFAFEQEIPLDDLVKMYHQIDELEVQEPSQQMDDDFYAMLKREKQLIENKSNRWSILMEQIVGIISVPQVPKLAYGFILLLVGLLAGNLLMPNRGYEKQISAMSSEMSEMREMMVLSMIKGDQATDRIKAVNYVDDMKEVDQKVIDALFKTLNNDENVNVRLVSLETLTKFTNLATVREGLVKSLEKQESPIVILELAEVLMQLQDKKIDKGA
ncbi:MAG: HEAT repeat domain-containing protein [Chloroflexia bacterium]|nr:HEAT repeat domain-containing protein [Chloroflexia bacterium]